MEKEGQEWNVLLPYVLFAYREIPQESTGFCPFELIYGRDVRGPVDILKEEWAKSKRSAEDIITYITKMKERLEEAEVVRSNLQKAQKK